MSSTQPNKLVHRKHPSSLKAPVKEGTFQRFYIHRQRIFFGRHTFGFEIFYPLNPPLVTVLFNRKKFYSSGPQRDDIKFKPSFSEECRYRWSTENGILSEKKRRESVVTETVLFLMMENLINKTPKLLYYTPFHCLSHGLYTVNEVLTKNLHD